MHEVSWARGVTDLVTRVNTSVTDRSRQSGYIQFMKDYQTPLARALREVRLPQAELARRLGTTKQQINKLVKGTNQMSLQWALKIAPHVDRLWPDLMELDDGVMDALRQSVIPTVSHDLGTNRNGSFGLNGGPEAGERVGPLDEAEGHLIRFWRTLDEQETATATWLLGSIGLGRKRK